MHDGHAQVVAYMVIFDRFEGSLKKTASDFSLEVNTTFDLYNWTA